MAEDTELVVVVSDLAAQAGCVEDVGLVARAAHDLHHTEAASLKADATVERLSRVEENGTEGQLSNTDGDPGVVTSELSGVLDVGVGAQKDEHVEDEDNECGVESDSKQVAEVASRVVLHLQLSLRKFTVWVEAAHKTAVEDHDGVKDDDEADQSEAPLVGTKVFTGIRDSCTGASSDGFNGAGWCWEVGSSVHDA